MKKTFTLFAALSTTIFSHSQQTFTNFENASLVIGQTSFSSQTVGRNNIVTYGPSYSAISSKGMLAVAEQTGGSVKIWYSIPSINGQPADVEVGNPNFTTSNNGPTQAYSRYFDGVAWSPDGNKLIAACGSQNRVLIWNSVPTSNGQPADVVLGQPDFTSAAAATTQTGLYYPCGVIVSPDGRLIVAEYYNNRVLIWNSIPTSNGAPADVVIGQPNFTSSTAGNQADRLSNPWGVNLSPDGKLLITNTGSNQVFIYDSIPETNGESATHVIGHNQFGLSTWGVSDSTLFMPVAATVTPDGKVAIGDFGNNRVLIYNQVPSINGEHADVVLGQPSFTSSTAFAPTGTADTNNMRSIYNVSTDLNGRIFVSGRDMHRVLVFGDLPTDSADLSISISESSSSLCDSSNVVYRIKILNLGPDTSENIVSTAAFPTGYSIESATTLDGTYNMNSGYWSIPLLNPNDSAILIIDGLVKSGMAGQTITSYANILNSSAIDTNLTNNGTSVSITILSISKPTDPIVSTASTCFETSASLTASGSGTLYWYANAADILPIGTGTNFNTGPLTANSTFYVEANNGCPSLNRIPVDVTIDPVYNQSESAVICSGDSYTFPDGTTQYNISVTTVHVSYLSTVNGCDSIITTTVTVNPVYNLSESAFICSGGSYTFPDGITLNNITGTTVHVSNLITANGCDSIITTTVSVNPVYNLSQTAYVCMGNNYIFPDGTVQYNIISTSIHTSYLTTINGCDSIITVTVNVNPVYNLSESASVCSGESYTFPDGTVQTNITATMVHVSNLLTVQGCDSIITTTININPVYSLTETAWICNGDSYTFPDGTLLEKVTGSTSHTSILVSTGGCDSIIVTNIEVAVINTGVLSDGTTLIAESAGLEYQWVNCSNYDVIPGATNRSFEPSVSGSYAVIITENECSDTSSCYTVTINNTSVITGFETDIKVYPNPTYGNITIDLNGSSGLVSVDIYDLQSKNLMKNSYENEDKIQLDLHSLEPGIYLIKLTRFGESKIFRVVKE